MRHAIIAFALLAAACGQTGAAPPVDASAGSTGVGNVAMPAFTLESEALVGLWSFDRTCGLFDLVFEADGDGVYYDNSADVVVSHVGTWTLDGERVVLTTRVLGADGAMGAETSVYNLSVTAAVTDDLIGHFARADGAEAREIGAKRCDDVEDRE
ncbi:hypothetical protein U91I_03363 [alpha proteobacterium U9-1i]|nr:hypothetical protein U91I_03363 [alpha proteobacterium U9-1i]